ncbi:uncharacterized protein FA14DRAFT_190312, partial [Meira miltonrushii]
MSEDDETMVLATIMQQRMDMLDSNPEMVEVTSKNYDVAARAAEVLRRHYIMDTAHSPAKPATPRPSAPIIASTPLVPGAFPGSSSHLQDDRKRQRCLANMMRKRMDLFDSNPKMVEVTSRNYDTAARATEVLRAYHNCVPHTFLENDFDMDTRTITYLDGSQLQDDPERQKKQNVTSGMLDLTKFSNADWTRLIGFVDAKIVAHANNLREEREIGKGEAYLSALKSLNQSDIVIEFLEENEILDHSELHEWSKKLMKKRIFVLLKNALEELQKRYPDLDVSAVTIEYVAEEEDDTSPATPLRQDSTIDDSGIAEVAQSVPSKMMNGSTPANHSSHLKEVTFADSLERGPQ